MLAIYWREVRDLLKSLRFLIALAIFLLGMAINGFVTARAYQDLTQMHRQIEAQNDERLGGRPLIWNSSPLISTNFSGQTDRGTC